MNSNDFDSLIGKLKNNRKFRNEFIKYLITDKEFIDIIAREVFLRTMESVGVNVPGTIAEFINKNIVKNDKT